MRTLLPRVALVLVAAGVLIAAGCSLSFSKRRVAQVESPRLASSRVKPLSAAQGQVPQEYEKARVKYEQAMKKVTERLQALEARRLTDEELEQVTAAGGPSFSERRVAKVESPSLVLSRIKPPPEYEKARLKYVQAVKKITEQLTDEELEQVTAAGPPSSKQLIAQDVLLPSQAPPPVPEMGKPSGEESPAPSQASPPPQTQTGAGEPEEEREVTRVPLASIERGGILLRPGRLTIEPSFSYSQSRDTRLIFTGFSVIPLIILGTLESEKVTRDSLSTSLTLRYGLMKDLNVAVTVPSSFLFQNRVRLSNERVGLVEEGATQFGLGDISAGFTYQALYERGWLPDLTVGLRLGVPTGRDQFDIFESIAKKGPFRNVEDFVSRLNAEGLSIGSGFWSLTGSVSWTKAFDPAVLFGTMGYTYSFPRTVTAIEIAGETAEGGIVLRPRAVTADLQPGGSIVFSLGVALVLTSQMSVNFSFSDRVVFSTKRDGEAIADSIQNVGQFSLGFTLALSRKVTLDFSGGFGLTADAPGMTFSFTVPVTFDSLKDLFRFL